MIACSSSSLTLSIHRGIGYATGGGQGDATPYIGYGIDDVLSYDIVLYNGSSVTASETENADLFWYLRGEIRRTSSWPLTVHQHLTCLLLVYAGGGSGIGVITSMDTAIIQSPEPENPNSSRKFTYVFLNYNQTEEKARTFLTRFQDFLQPDIRNPKKYLEAIKAGSSRFGGGASFNIENSKYGGGGFVSASNRLGFQGVFLGSEEEAAKVFTEYGLLDPEILTFVSTSEKDSYGEVMAFQLCTTLGLNGLWFVWTAGSPTNFNICDDLGLDDEKCTSFPSGVPGLNISYPNPFDGGSQCEDPDVLNAIIKASGMPQSFFNRGGGELLFQAGVIPEPSPSLIGGLLMPRVEVDVLVKIAKLGVQVNHLNHGAYQAE